MTFGLTYLGRLGPREFWVNPRRPACPRHDWLPLGCALCRWLAFFAGKAP